MKLTTGIVFLGMVAGTALAQNPTVINNTRDTLKAVEQRQTAASNQALAASQGEASNPGAAFRQASPMAKPEGSKQINISGRRDPFLSPVVNRSMLGAACSTGKRCLAIDQINLKGVVKADSGMIAVVVNSLNKAYFLRENDPVFNGFVVKITGDSIVFKETVQDHLGKPSMREVTKKITTSAV
jgi:Tfp pilus assembly protein PilP